MYQYQQQLTESNDKIKEEEEKTQELISQLEQQNQAYIELQQRFEHIQTEYQTTIM